MIKAKTILKESLIHQGGIGLFAIEPIKKRKVVLYLHLSNHLPKIHVDRIQIEQVVINLVRNSLDAMDDIKTDNRKLTLETSQSETKEVVLAVHDTGRGISDQDKNRIFQSFFTTKPEGLGLGLAISRSIIEAHHGSVVAQNRQNGGAIFTIKMPVEISGIGYIEKLPE